jgi:hypothetical protein
MHPRSGISAITIQSCKIEGWRTFFMRALSQGTWNCAMFLSNVDDGRMTNDGEGSEEILVIEDREVRISNPEKCSSRSGARPSSTSSTITGDSQNP